MTINREQKQSVTLFENIAKRLADKLPTKTKSFFLNLILGALLAALGQSGIFQFSHPEGGKILYELSCPYRAAIK